MFNQPLNELMKELIEDRRVSSLSFGDLDAPNRLWCGPSIYPMDSKVPTTSDSTTTTDPMTDPWCYIWWHGSHQYTPVMLAYGYGSKLGTPKLWMVNTTLDIHICGPLGLLFWPTSIYASTSRILWGWSLAVLHEADEISKKGTWFWPKHANKNPGKAWTIQTKTSGYVRHSYWKWPFINSDFFPLRMVIFNSYVKLPEGKTCQWALVFWGIDSLGWNNISMPLVMDPSCGVAPSGNLSYPWKTIINITCKSSQCIYKLL